MITFGLPPYYTCFASMSPNVLQTESHPGSTQNGPRRYEFYILMPDKLGIFVIVCV